MWSFEELFWIPGRKDNNGRLCLHLTNNLHCKASLLNLFNTNKTPSCNHYSASQYYTMNRTAYELIVLHPFKLDQHYYFTAETNNPLMVSKLIIYLIMTELFLYSQLTSSFLSLELWITKGMRHLQQTWWTANSFSGIVHGWITTTTTTQI